MNILLCACALSIWKDPFMHLVFLVLKYQWKADSKTVLLYLPNYFIVDKMLHVLSLIELPKFSKHLRREKLSFQKNETS